jgi:hypothetical protein
LTRRSAPGVDRGMLGSMKANTPKKPFAVVILTALGVLPVPAEALPPRSPLASLNPIELDHATLGVAVMKTHADIRAGRLGH